MLSGCNTLPKLPASSQIDLAYVQDTPEPDKPVAPVDNGKLAAYVLGFKAQLRECNLDKQSQYDLYVKNQGKK